MGCRYSECGRRQAAGCRGWRRLTPRHATCHRPELEVRARVRPRRVRDGRRELRVERRRVNVRVRRRLVAPVGPPNHRPKQLFPDEEKPSPKSPMSHL
jgi:hypothetical protein